jgi:hypothetical protein
MCPLRSSTKDLTSGRTSKDAKIFLGGCDPPDLASTPPFFTRKLDAVRFAYWVAFFMIISGSAHHLGICRPF